MRSTSILSPCSITNPLDTADAVATEQAKLYANNIVKYRREIAGVADSTDVQAFDADRLKTWFAKPPITCSASAPYPFVFIAIDPAGGGNQSDCAMLIFTFDLDNRCVVIGAESVMMMDSTSEKVRRRRNGFWCVY